MIGTDGETGGRAGFGRMTSVIGTCAAVAGPAIGCTVVGGVGTVRGAARFTRTLPANRVGCACRVALSQAAEIGVAVWSTVPVGGFGFFVTDGAPLAYRLAAIGPTGALTNLSTGTVPGFTTADGLRIAILRQGPLVSGFINGVRIAQAVNTTQNPVTGGVAAVKTTAGQQWTDIRQLALGIPGRFALDRLCAA